MKWFANEQFIPGEHLSIDIAAKHTNYLNLYISTSHKECTQIVKW